MPKDVELLDKKYQPGSLPIFGLIQNTSLLQFFVFQIVLHLKKQEIKTSLRTTRLRVVKYDDTK